MGVIRHIIPQPAKDKLGLLAEKHLPVWAQKSLASVATAGGLALDIAGAKRGGKVGAVEHIASELCDDIDGDLARRFLSVSKGTALLDAGVDKLKKGIEIYRGFKNINKVSESEQLKRKLALGFIATKQVANMAVASIAEAKGREPEVTMAGKVNMWMDGVAMSSFEVADAVKPGSFQDFANKVGYYTLVASVVPESVALYQMSRVAFGNNQDTADTTMPPQPQFSIA